MMIRNSLPVWQLLIALAAWIFTDIAMHYLNWWFFAAISGQTPNLSQVQFGAFVGDRVGWAGVLPEGTSLAVPPILLACFLLSNRSAKFRFAVYAGVAIASAQCLVWMIDLAFFRHLAPLAAGLQFYASRFVVLIPGPVAAWGMLQIRFGEHYENA